MIFTSVAEIAKQHFLLVRVVFAARAVLAVRALPLVVGDEVKEVEREPYARGVTALAAFGAVEQFFGHADFVAEAIAGTDLTLGAGNVAV